MKAAQNFQVRLITLTVIPLLMVCVSVISYGQGGSGEAKGEKGKAANVRSPRKNKPAKKGNTASLNWKRNQRYGFYLMYRDSTEIGRVAAQIRKILLENSFKPVEFSRVSKPSSLYAYDRKLNNSYLTFSSSTQHNVREEVTRLIREILPDVHIDLTGRPADSFSLWII